MRTVAQGLAAGLLFWSLGSHAATAVLFESDPGDYIGQGQTQTFTTVQASGSSTHVTVNFGPYSADFIVPRGSTLAAGSNFGGATRYPFNSPTQPGLSISGDGRGCNTLTGWFEVREALFNAGGQPARLAIDFKQNCEGGSSALYGAVRINSDVPLQIPALAAIGGRDLNAKARDVLALDASKSFAHGNASSSLAFTWTQISGTPVTLNGAATSLADFTAPLVPPGGEDLVFQLGLSSGGNTDTDTVKVHVSSKSDPQTFLHFESETGDYIGLGRNFTLTSLDGDISLTTNYRGGVSLSFNGDTFWNLDFGVPSGATFAIGAYENAQRFAFADADKPGIDVSGDGRGCNTIAGRFDVLDLLKTNSGTIARLALDYEQHCEGGPAALRGEVRWNYLEPGIPTAVAGSDQSVVGGSNVVLDGSSSSDDRGLVLYQWRQTQGPAVSLLGANTSRASFVAPTTTTPQTLQFQLMVADENDLTGADSIIVTTNPTSTNSNSGKSGGGGAMSTTTILGALLMAFIRRRVQSFRSRAERSAHASG